MMLAGGSFELAQARIHARLAARPGVAAWSRLESIRDPGAFLEAAGAVLPGLAALALTARTPVHTIEQRLIDFWRGIVSEVASWLPAPWRSPVEWLATLARLPAVVHLERGREARGWMEDDAELRRLLRRAPAPPPQPVASAGWHRRWRSRLPAMRGDDARSLQAIERVVTDHLVRYAAASPKDAWVTRRQLEASLIGCLRRHPLTPVPAFALVALSGLDLERFRSELLGRVLFGARPR
jgi:hypothetical protein